MQKNKNNIIIDVGANSGEFCLEIVKRNPDIKVVAFEPEPVLYKNLAEKNIENLKVYKLALANVSNKENRQLFVSHKGDWGTSSLLNFNKENLQKNEYWNLRSDLVYDETINVEVCSLESVLDSIEFDEIAFLKIDSQGFDLDILKSAGKYFEKIQAGMIEVPAIKETSLYDGESDTLVEALSFLKDKNYKVYAIKSNDEAGNEYNIFFNRPDIDIKLLETLYNLKNLPIYDGKNYWFLPSNVPHMQIDLNIINHLNQTKEIILNLENNIINRLVTFEERLNELNKLNKLNSIEERLARLEEKIYKPSIFAKVITWFIPSKKLRRKIRGQK